jgi:hypothetical protein
MIAAFFLNPGFLFIAAALISVPIIIHLINRMRFKRIRWAAMEFLLKAAKRTRRRLIIEQLLLLALRCLLLALVGLLVSRFIGCGDANLSGKPNLHFVLLDDTLSMQDHWKGPDGNVNCFDVAKNDFLLKKIAKGLSASKTNDQLIILPLSKLDDPNFEVKNYTYERLNDTQNLKALTTAVNELQPSMLHVKILPGVKAARKIISTYPESRVTLHVLSDFRHSDWSGSAGEGLTKELLDLADTNKDIKIRPIDTVHPARAASQGSFPPARDNVGIVDFRPSTRIVGHKMLVRFTISIANYSGKYVDAKLVARNEETGNDMDEVDFTTLNLQNPNDDRAKIKLAPSSVTAAAFEFGNIKNGLFFKDREPRPGESRFAHLSVRLTNAQKQPLDNDGILADNIRHAVVEVRDKVPILVIDGEGAKGREENKDSFFLRTALLSIPGANYDVVFGDELTRGAAVKALEQSDLSKYPTIFLLNVRELAPDQLKNLENFVKEGGGVAFYMGPQVNAVYYNKSLYKDGKGVFPAPLKTTYFPAPNEKELPTKEDSDTYQLITRDEKFPGRAMPIFGAIFEEPKQREALGNLPIHRYFKVDRGLWRPEEGRVFELATLPNEAAAAAFNANAGAIIAGENVKAIMANPELAQYTARLQQHLKEIEDKVNLGKEFKAYHLANQIDALMNDKGNPNAKPPVPAMTAFWENPDARVRLLKDELANLREAVNYGDPFVITHTFGKGKVVAVLSTVGKEWNDWAGGSAASVLFTPFIWEMQNYLSSPGADANLTVGTNLPLTLNAKQFEGKQLKLVREFMKTKPGVPAEAKEIDKQFGKPDNDQIVFNMTNNREPGLYISKLYDENTPEKGPLSVFAHAFNVDTPNEGQLQRIGSEELERDLISRAKVKGAIVFVNQTTPEEMLVSKTNDLSESPWLFLILLLVLVAEQALAVHLSFHLKNTENDMSPAGVKA